MSHTPSIAHICANCSIVTVNGTERLFSYKTLVGVRTPDGKTFKTSTKWSNTTTRHINKAGFGNGTPIPQEELEAML